MVRILSAGEESTRLGHLVAVLEVRAGHESDADDAGKDEAYDGRVALPVGGLGVPTSGWRPDVLWVSEAVSSASCAALEKGAYGILPPPPMIANVCAGSWGSRSASLT